MIEIEAFDDQDERCGVCQKSGTSHVITRDGKPIVALCGRCVASGRGPAALKARRMSKALYKEAAALQGVARLIDECDDRWPNEEWGRD